ncbi:DUF4269 domain-containing protein [Paenibacillus sp. Marseille-Q4541]|uniref:DUF4269 domain-containing protein n=1 Tax=Paenibacillus sp. Marseille-Q4541 TaxID=2831522 RepID=UPI002018F298|nr:DUF4269 domain-containing protein [Paenibacillus sp. Marseille-Q4541]
MNHIPFGNLDYLLEGSEVQQAAYRVLRKYKVMEILSPFTPVLTGTIPIHIDIEGSDLDIICEVYDFHHFEQLLRFEFGNRSGFVLKDHVVQGIRRMKANLQLDQFEIEIFGQPIPVTEQNAYRHMIIEDRILRLSDEEFRQMVRSLKRDGYKTEPAFAILMGLEGDPYESMFEVNQWTDEKIAEIGCSFTEIVTRVYEFTEKKEYHFPLDTRNIEYTGEEENRELFAERYHKDHSIYVSRGKNRNEAHLFFRGASDFTCRCTILDLSQEKFPILEAMEASVIEDTSDDNYDYYDVIDTFGVIEVTNWEWSTLISSNVEKQGTEFFGFIESFLLTYFRQLVFSAKDMEGLEVFMKQTLPWAKSFYYEGELYYRFKYF